MQRLYSGGDRTVKCYRCEGDNLQLSALTRQQKADYGRLQIVHRTCQDCGTGQNHVGDDETLDPREAERLAPEVFSG